MRIETALLDAFRIDKVLPAGTTRLNNVCGEQRDGFGHVVGTIVFLPIGTEDFKVAFTPVCVICHAYGVRHHQRRRRTFSTRPTVDRRNPQISRCLSIT